MGQPHRRCRLRCFEVFIYCAWIHSCSLNPTCRSFPSSATPPIFAFSRPFFRLPSSSDRARHNESRVVRTRPLLSLLLRSSHFGPEDSRKTNADSSIQSVLRTCIPRNTVGFPTTSFVADQSDHRNADTITSSSSCSSVTRVSASLACFSGLPTTPTPSPTFLQLASISYVEIRSQTMV